MSWNQVSDKSNNSNKKGMEAELIAVNYLINNGLKFIVKNFYSRFGEIDIIMQDKDALVFVEVKKRIKGFTDGIESITYSKQQKLVKTANYYLLKYANYNQPCRFDAVIFNADNQVMWLKNIITL